MEPLTPTGEKLMVPKVSFQGEQVVSQARPNRPQEPSKKDTWGLGQGCSPSSLHPTMVLFWGWADIFWPLFGQPPASGRMNF